MSTEAAKNFIAIVASDEALALKVREAGTNVDEIIKLGKENGLEFTAGDMKAAHDETKDLLGEELLTFLGKVSTDDDLTGKLAAAGTDVDEVIRLGKENGCEFTVDNLMALQRMTVKSDAELSDEELENVAGGVVTALVATVGTLMIIGGLAVAVGAGAGFMIGKGSAFVAQQRG